MNKTIIVSVVLAMSCLGFAQENAATPSSQVLREKTEWCDIWIASANCNEKPRVLLVGDSITKGYYPSVAGLLEDVAYCAKFATSACVADPGFLDQLKVMFNHYDYAVVHFNNGLHMFEYTDQEYRAGYEQALTYIRQQAPVAKIVLALTTPLQSTSEKDNLNVQVDARNRIVRDLAKKFGAETDDLHSISENHPEYYKDPYHYKPEAVNLQGRQVSGIIRNLLNRE